MPKYRAVHLKIIDSFDFNEMPDDFARVTWMLLILIVDSEGRGIDSPAWIRSRMYPMREGITSKQIKNAFDWYADRGMIIRYEIKEKHYFYIPTFYEYQTHTEREAKSILPSPEEENNNSGVGLDKIKSFSNTYVYESVYESESVKKRGEITADQLPDCLKTPGFVQVWVEWAEYRAEIKHKITTRTAKKQLEMLSKVGPVVGAQMLNQSIVNGWIGIFPLKNGNRPTRTEPLGLISSDGTETI